MTLRSNARVAGWTFLLYIVVGLTSVYVGRGSTAGDTTAARLASIAAHASRVRTNVVLGCLVFCIALALAVSLYGITRGEDHELSVFALCCRVAEAVGGVVPVVSAMALLDIATQAPLAEPGGTYAAADLLLRLRRLNPMLTAMFFAVGSTVFAYLMLRGRLVPRGLAWLGVAASLLLVVLLPAQLIGVVGGSVAQVMWLPMLVFEVTLAFWLIIKGVTPPAAQASLA